jgi:MYXO-CTERM domain-containing protein
MHRAAFVPIAMVAWGLLAGVAQAQTITPRINRFEGRTASESELARLATTAQNPIGAAECDATITFQFNGIDPTRASLRFYEGANCNDPAVRTSTTTTSCNELSVPPVAIDGRSEREVGILARDLVPCDEGGSAVETIWVLALNNVNDTVTGRGQQVSFPIAFDFVPPSAPTSVASGGGEVDALVSWASSGDQVSEFQIFVDPTGCTDGVVTSPVLTMSPPDETALSGLLAGTAGNTAASARVSFPAEVPIGGQMAVAVRAIDRAQNIGALSTPICVDRFEVTSWWDTYCGSAEAPAVCTNGGCSVAPVGGQPIAWVGALVAATLVLVSRRRSR